jgi:hypothetical protein
MNQRALPIGFVVLIASMSCGPVEQAPPYDEGLPGDARVPGSLIDIAPITPASIYDVPRHGADPAEVEEPPLEEPPVEEPTGPVVEPPTADCAHVRVTGTGGVTLNVRPDPSTAGAPVGSLSPGEVVQVVGVVGDGQDVNGTTTWFQIDDGFISAAFAQCHDPDAYVPGFFLPLACGTSTTITQGNNSSFSHNGHSRYAFDFSLPRGTPLVAIDDGIVAFADGSTRPGDPCWSGGGSSCIGEANYIVVEHPDGSQSMYAHLNEPSLSVGDVVLRGEQVGLSGGTGWSTGPHAHVARISGCGTAWCDSIPLSFQDVDGDGVPVTGETVTSNNCP